jgi:hypothetical protein
MKTPIKLNLIRHTAHSFPEQYRKLACILMAETVLPVFEKQRSNEPRPRIVLEAAKACCLNPTEENLEKLRKARDGAEAAYTAAYVAYWAASWACRAEAAYWAAEAVYWAAKSVYYSSEAAYWAAEAAYRATKAKQGNIQNMLKSLMEQESSLES